MPRSYVSSLTLALTLLSGSLALAVAVAPHAKAQEYFGDIGQATETTNSKPSESSESKESKDSTDPIDAIIRSLPPLATDSATTEGKLPTVQRMGADSSAQNQPPSPRISTAQAKIYAAQLQAATTPPRGLEQKISALWKAFPGRTGIAIHRIDKIASDSGNGSLPRVHRTSTGGYMQIEGGWLLSWRGGDLFPQQSVSKLWVAMAVLAEVDAGRVRLDDKIRIARHDLTLFYQPLAATIRKKGAQRLSVDYLLQRAIAYSDNTANDALLRHIGGSQTVRAFINRHRLGAIRFGPGERLLQSRIAGLRWHQSMSIDNNFQKARARLPWAKRQAAMRAYLADPMDGASPDAIAKALARLAQGELLSPQSTQYLLKTLQSTKSGPNRLKAGFPKDWRFGHKTGTGQNLRPITAGYNDIGIATAPDGTRYAVVVLLANTTARVPARMRLMQAVSAAVASGHRQQKAALDNIIKIAAREVTYDRTHGATYDGALDGTHNTARDGNLDAIPTSFPYLPRNK